MGLLRLFLSFVKDFIAPPLCCHCQAEGSFLCGNCYEQIEYAVSKPLPAEHTSLDNLIWLGPFTGVVKSLILSLKYRGQKEVGQVIGQLIFHTVTLPIVDLITAVPAHSDRLKERGFNQSALIAQTLAYLTATHYLELLTRTKKIAPQASIAHKGQRQARQANTMAVITSHQKSLATSGIQTILLIDDVYTTGATLNEAARALKVTNPSLKVIGLTVAHA